MGPVAQEQGRPPVAGLARQLSWGETARHFRLNWKSVAAAVKRAVAWGLAHRRRQPLRWIGIDEVSRRKGHRYLTVVYDLERRTLLWVGEDRTEQTLREFFSALGRPAARSVCGVGWWWSMAVRLRHQRTRCPTWTGSSG